MNNQSKATNNLKKRLVKFSSHLVVASIASSMLITPALFANSSNLSPISAASVASTSSVVISESAGHLESAYVEWSPVKNATGYNVYYKAANASDSAYKQIDTELIRQYSSYMRADVLGLKAGNYVIKVVPIVNGAEAAYLGASTSSLSVQAQVREGFAFSDLSPMGTGSGGYNDDGTVPSDAQIIYVTPDTASSVTLDVITDTKGTTTTCTGIADILAKRQKGKDQRHLIIRVIGKVDSDDVSGLNSKGYLQVKGSYNTTIEGVGEDATISGWGLLVRDAHNIEIRNLGVMLFPDDGISLDTGNENIWVHNNDIFYGTAGSDADQAKGDGSCDVKGHSTYVTVSYNHFFDSGKCSLCGMSDSQEFFVTYHHNWYDHSDSRHPRIRVGTIHIYNNYFDGNSKYGVGITKGGSAFVEANYFRNCHYPMIISMQSTDIYSDPSGILSGEPGGMIKAYNNIILGENRLVKHTDDPVNFDGYFATSRNEQVPSSYKTVSGGNTYNNFDTSSKMYDYTPHAPSEVESVVKAYAGRVNGGDLKWTFTEADDTSYSMNKELMAAIKAYESDLVSIGGGSIVTTPDATVAPTVAPTATPAPTVAPTATPVPTTAPTVAPTATPAPTSAPEQSENVYSHNFTTDGLNSNFFAITGSLSDSKGTVNYNGLTLTTCLKIESSTNISFTTTQDATLTLVFNSDKTVKVDGTKYTAKNGIVTVTLPAGSHTIKKDNPMNLYYMTVAY